MNAVLGADALRWMLTFVRLTEDFIRRGGLVPYQAKPAAVGHDAGAEVAGEEGLGGGAKDIVTPAMGDVALREGQFAAHDGFELVFIRYQPGHDMGVFAFLAQQEF